MSTKNWLGLPFVMMDKKSTFHVPNFKIVLVIIGVVFFFANTVLLRFISKGPRVEVSLDPGDVVPNNVKDMLRRNGVAWRGTALSTKLNVFDGDEKSFPEREIEEICSCIEKGGKLVHIINHNLMTTKENARNGGPVGELLVYNSLLMGLKELAMEKSVCVLDISHSEQEIGQNFIKMKNRLKTCSKEQKKIAQVDENTLYHFVIIEMYSISFVLENILRVQGEKCVEFYCNHFEKNSCRYIFVDFWGTPGYQNHLKVNLKQYLVPYPNGYNQFIGYITNYHEPDTIVQKIPDFYGSWDLGKGRWGAASLLLRKIGSILKTKQLELEWNAFKTTKVDVHRQNFYFILKDMVNKTMQWIFKDNYKSEKLEIVVWGKNQGYFNTEVIYFLQAIVDKFGDNVTIHTTLSKDNTLLPFANNHGVLGKEEWFDLLRKSHFVMGLGDPVIGPTAFDGISTGAILLDPVYNQPRHLSNLNGELRLSSQHPYAVEFIGQPYTLPFRFSDSPSDVFALDRLKINFESDNLEDIIFKYLVNYVNNRVLTEHVKLKGFILEEYTLDGITNRIQTDILDKFSVICPTAQHLADRYSVNFLKYH